MHLSRIKIWSLFTIDKTKSIHDPIKAYEDHLKEMAESKAEVVDSYNLPVSLGEYNPNFVIIEQDLNKQLKNYVSNKEMRGTLKFWQWRLIRMSWYLEMQAKESKFRNLSELEWKAYNIKPIKTINPSLFSNSSVMSMFDKEIKPIKEGLTNFAMLCKLGIPKDIRPTIWLECFRHLVDIENSYSYYIDMKKDSIVLRQIEEDVNKDIDYKEQVEIIRIAKAYCIWCTEQNQKMKEEKFIYYRGIMSVIEKLHKVLDEVHTFLSLIGFANVLPYFFKTRSGIIGNVSFNHHLILLLINNIIEKECPRMYEKIVSCGLPLECYIADKVFTLFATVFPIDTLLRIYDLIVLEVDSKGDPLWIIIAVCTMLLTLNEDYILKAQNIEELRLIINNTGINYLNTQSFINEVYKQSEKLFCDHNSLWKQIAEQESGSSDNKFIKKFQGAFPHIRKLLTSASSTADETVQINKFVKYFCEYYDVKAEQVIRVHLYLDKCYNLPLEYATVKVSYEKQCTDSLEVKENGIIDRALEFIPEPNKTPIKITFNDYIYCEIDLKNYGTNMPITISKSLYPSEHKEVWNERRPQPFISVVLLMITKEEEDSKADSKFLKQCIMKEERYIKTKELVQNNIEKGYKKILIPDIRDNPKENSENYSEIEKKVLRDLFARLRSSDKDEQVKKVFIADEVARKVTDKVHKIFSHRSPNESTKIIPIKRIIYSIIALSNLTINTKLSFLYEICRSVGNRDINNEVNKSLLLDDVIELVQVLCELHNVKLSPKAIANLTEYTLRGSISEITNCYLITQGIDIETVLEQKNTKEVRDVSKEIQKTFSDHWEVYGHKQAFISNISLGKILNKKYPKKPYRLLICYRYLGNRYYKVLEYDKRGILINRKVNDLLADNISFIGERINLSKEEFIDKMKNISLLIEPMIMNVSLNNVLVDKTEKKLKVKYLENETCKLEVIFIKPSNRPHNSPKKNLYTIEIPLVHTEDLLLEIQSRIVNEVRKLKESKEYGIELESNVNYLDYSLQFFYDNTPLDDHSRLGVRVIINIGTQ